MRIRRHLNRLEEEVRDHSADYVAQPDEDLWDHANRVTLLSVGRLLAATEGENDADSGNIAVLAIIAGHKSKDVGNCLATYTLSQRDNQQALRQLLKARESLRERFVWEQRPNGEFAGPIISSQGGPAATAMIETSFAFIQFVKTWQPLMDAMAALIWLVCTITQNADLRRPKSFTELCKLAAQSSWAATTPNIRELLEGTADWYLSTLRVLRNQLVHNERTATLIPRINSLRTLVEVKKPHFNETADTFDLDDFLSFAYGHFLVFCVGFATATDAMY
jgi:hypothetical protein